MHALRRAKNAVQVVVRTPVALLAAIDAEVSRRREAHLGQRVGRSDAIRTLLHKAVASLALPPTRRLRDRSPGDAANVSELAAVGACGSACGSRSRPGCTAAGVRSPKHQSNPGCYAANRNPAGPGRGCLFQLPGVRTSDEKNDTATVPAAEYQQLRADTLRYYG